MRHVTRMNESCHTYEWVMSHIWIRHVTHINEACHTYEWVMSHLAVRFRARHMWFEACHVVWGVSCGWDVSQREGVMSHIHGSCQIQMCLVTYECHVCDTSHVWTRRSTARWSRVTFKWVMSHMWHVTRAVEAWHTEKELPAKFKWMGHVTCECVVSESGPWEWGLLYRGPTVGQDLSIYRGVAKPYRGPLYQAGRWLNSFGFFLNLILPFFSVVNPGIDNPKG